MSTRDSISIAVLSGNEDDVALINSALRDSGLATHCHWVEKMKSLAATLGENQVELIVLNLDSFADPIRAVIKQKDIFNPEVPVIAVQRDADESGIEAAMRQGAVDLVSLKHLNRLQSVVSRELRALRVERALNSTLQSATEYKKQIREYMQTSAAAISLVQDGIVLEANKEWLRVFRAASIDELAGMPVMDSFDPDSRPAIKGALNAALHGKWKTGQKLAVKPNIDDGELGELHLELLRIEYDGQPCVQVRVPPEDLRSNEPTKLVHDALQRDPTTLFFHRAQFIERIKKRMIKRPTSGLHMLAYIKPDNFREVRSKVGVLNSEEVLAQFAEIVRKRLHPRDVAGRFEGTALMVLLERAKERDGQVWGQQLVDYIKSQTFGAGDVSTHMTASVGVCAVSRRFDSFEEFIAATISTCDAARKSGGGKSLLNEADEEDTKQKEIDQTWARQLKFALTEDRFRLAQLPIAGLRSDAVEMFELLVRMIDEEGNAVLPSEFLPAAERTNLMKSVDRWIIRASLGFCEKSNADRVFVKMSRQSIVDKTTADWLKSECDERGFDASRLVIQVPERDAARHIRQSKDLAKKLKKFGIGFALEHFGSADDKFQILNMLQPDYIKIDGELMHTLMTDKSIQSRVEAIVAAAAAKGIKTVAERVENANAMAVLFQLGIDYMQGHYVHEPEVVLEDASDSVKPQTLAQLMAAG